MTNSFENSPGFFFLREWGERDFLFFPLFPMRSHHVPRGNRVGSGDIVLELGFGLPALKSMARKECVMFCCRCNTSNSSQGIIVWGGWMGGLVVVTTAGVGFVMGSGEVLDWVGLCWTTVGTVLAAASANAFNRVPLCSTFVSTFVFTYFGDVSKSRKSVSSSDPFILLLWFRSLCIKNRHILCCGLHVVLYIFRPRTACLDLSLWPNLSILSHYSFPERALIWKLASPLYRVWNSIFGNSRVYTS